MGGCESVLGLEKVSFLHFDRVDPPRVFKTWGFMNDDAYDQKEMGSTCTIRTYRSFCFYRASTDGFSPVIIHLSRYPSQVF